MKHKMANGQQILILPEGALRTTGKSAQRNNITAAKAVADIVKTTLGPRGMDKMLVSDIGDIVITNDGATIVEEMDVEHPAAKMVVEVAKTQDKEVGDGTTTAVVLTGELLSNAEKLLDKGVHPTVISRGYKMAAEKSQEILNKIGNKVSIEDEQLLRRISETAMTGKGAESAKESLSNLCVTAVKRVATAKDGKYSIDRDDIQIEKKQGGSIHDSELIEGVLLDKERASASMPQKVENPKIALIDAALEIKKTETDAKIRITSADQLVSFTQQEEKILKEKADAISQSGATAVFCQKGMDDMVIHYLSKAGVFAVKNVSESNMKRLAKATGGRVVSNLKELSKDDLGHAKAVEEKKISGDEMIFVSGCKNPKAVSILVRGGTEHVVDEVERAVTDAVGGVAAALEMGSAVAGGGACEIELSHQIRKYAESINGREQLAINAFADSMEIIPRTLAESAGMDSIDTLVKLRADHEKKGKDMGVEAIAGRIEDMWKKGIIEPLKIKVQAIKSASEAAQMILRIDDVIASSKKSGPSMPPGGMGGMGDY